MLQTNTCPPMDDLLLCVFPAKVKMEGCNVMGNADTWKDVEYAASLNAAHIFFIICFSGSLGCKSFLASQSLRFLFP